MNVSLTEKQEKYIDNQIETGDFQNASELVRDALHISYLLKLTEILKKYSILQKKSSELIKP